MTAQNVELLALGISEMNGAFVPKTEAFIFRNPGRLRSGGSLRQFTTISGGLKSLISELVRYEEKNQVVAVAANYGCDKVEKEFLFLDYLTRAFGRDIKRSTTLAQLESGAEEAE